jgi:type VI secretion system protein
MTSHRSLLQRLEHVETSRKPYAGVRELQDAVRDHLQRMLNTRQGNSITVPDFGTPDFSGFFRGYDSIQYFREEVKRTIQKFEPRLTNVQIAVDPEGDEPFRMRFNLHAVLQDEDQQGPVVFSTVVECSGEVTVK